MQIAGKSDCHLKGPTLVRNNGFRKLILERVVIWKHKRADSVPNRFGIMENTSNINLRSSRARSGQKPECLELRHERRMRK